MKILRKNNVYDKDTDILVRVYENQDPNHGEKEQIASEVLFKEHCNHDHERFTSWLPRGAVVAIVQVLNNLPKNNYKVQISNELPNEVGVLTSCRDNFDRSKEWDNLKAIKLKQSKSDYTIPFG